MKRAIHTLLALELAGVEIYFTSYMLSRFSLNTTKQASYLLSFGPCNVTLWLGDVESGVDDIIFGTFFFSRLSLESRNLHRRITIVVHSIYILYVIY